MQLLYDLFPILVFFILYKLQGIYVATAAAMAISLLQVIYYRLRHHRFEHFQMVTLACIIFFGGATLIFHNPKFIQWKPSVLYWLCALVFLGSQIFAKKTLVATLMDRHVALRPRQWTALNLVWIAFFSFMGSLNLYVVYHFSESAWVNFKLFGILGLTLIFFLAQALLLSRKIQK